LDYNLIRFVKADMDVRALWHVSYWDGPIAGMAMINDGKFVWYEMIHNRELKRLTDIEYEMLSENQKAKVEEIENGDRVLEVPRIYALYDLNEQQIDNEFMIHGIWELNGVFNMNYYPLHYELLGHTEAAKKHFKTRQDNHRKIDYGKKLAEVTEDQMMFERRAEEKLI
jgi:hypothetical protein